MSFVVTYSFHNILHPGALDQGDIVKTFILKLKKKYYSIRTIPTNYEIHQTNVFITLLLLNQIGDLLLKEIPYPTLLLQNLIKHSFKVKKNEERILLQNTVDVFHFTPIPSTNTLLQYVYVCRVSTSRTNQLSSTFIICHLNMTSC